MAAVTLSATCSARTAGNSSGLQTAHPRDLGPHICLPVLEAHPQDRLLGPTRRLFIRSFRKQHRALCRPPPAPSRQRYSNLQRSPSLVPHPQAEGQKAVAQLVLCRALGVQGPDCCSRPPLS